MTSDQPRLQATADQAVAQKVLVALRHDLMAELDASLVALEDLRRQRASRVDDDEHDPEGLPLSGEWSRLDGLRRATQGRIAEVDVALANAEAGHYGVCLACGRGIPPRRLEARPTATLCVACATR